ncbi:MAG: ligand-binding protein SH3, partial [Methanomicrobiales archaeon HGW-Methanomicrobiales-5]
TRRHSDLVEKYETLGLILFVAIPLPMTGAWSGCVAAYLLGIKFVHAITAITIGVLVAGLIVGSASMGALSFF